MALIITDNDTDRAINMILSYNEDSDLFPVSQKLYHKLVYLDHYGRNTKEGFRFGDPESNLNVELFLDGGLETAMETGKFNFSVVIRNKKDDSIFMCGGLIHKGESLDYKNLRKMYDLSDVETAALIKTIQWEMHT